MLSLPFQRRHLRRIAGLTLLAWVLALLTGMVNACQHQPHGHGMHAIVVYAQGDSTEQGMHAMPALHTENSGHAGVGRHEGQTDSGKTACLKFCEDESSTAAKGETAQADFPGVVVATSIDWQLAQPVAISATGRSIDRQGSQGPPLFVRFLRLTL